MNHSCNPNLDIYGVLLDVPDTRLTKISLFAIRNIVPGEELCFDYRYDPKTNKSNKTLRCYCGASNCRSILF